MVPAKKDSGCEVERGVCPMCEKTFFKETERQTVRSTMLHMAAVHPDELETVVKAGWLTVLRLVGDMSRDKAKGKGEPQKEKGFLETLLGDDDDE
ncbi:unnamed protein product [marine sediment metagenome]|uniref:Uncharacterized protein n=1 Tax=marine sediment metagenome TaxID=412755 RepID=X1Q1E7_9ZZZZ